MGIIEQENHQLVISYNRKIAGALSTCLIENQCMGSGSCFKGRIADDCVTRKNEAEGVIENTNGQIKSG